MNSRLKDVKTACQSCGKGKTSGTLSSVTSWLFKSGACSCDTDARTQPEEKLVTSSEDITDGTVANGEIIDGRYEVLGHLGSGAMGEVYRVVDKTSQAEYALKLLAPQFLQDKALAKRLEHEALASRTLSHANIASVFDARSITGGAPYLLMEFIDGENLEDVLNEQTILPTSRAIDIFIQIAEALYYAHQKGIVHRDLKPSNVLLTKTPGGLDIVKIVDFGIAKIVQKEGVHATKLTQTGELLGTPLYMSPEQCRGDELDLRSDIYSLGCMMYEVLTGAPPFTGENPVRVILKHLSDAPLPFPKSLRLSDQLERVVMRCLEKERSDRLATAHELVLDLERVRDGKPLKGYGTRKKVAKRMNIVLVAAAVALVGLPVAFFAWQSSRNSSSPPVVVRPQLDERYKGWTLAQWTAAIEKAPEDAELYFDRGTLHDRRDERTNAIDDYTQAISLRPDYVQAYRARAGCYTMVADYSNALKDADHLVRIAPDSQEGYSARGFVHDATEQYVKSTEDYQKALEIDNSPYYRYSLARSLMKAGRIEEAQKAISRAVRNGENYEAYDSFLGISGILNTFTHNYDAALEDFTKATQRQKDRGAEWQAFAHYYVSKGDLPAAEKAIERGKALETFPARGHRLAGEVYRTAGMYDKAIQEFSASTSLEEYPPGYRERAVTYVALGQWRAALADLKKSFKLNPHSATTVSYLALVEYKLGATTEGDRYLQQALANPSKPPIVFVNKAAIELMRGQTSEAFKSVDVALSIDPWLKEGYEMRGQIQEALGAKAAAESDRLKAAQLTSHVDF